MVEPVEVAIEIALLARAEAFATAQNVPISMPNIKFTPPTAGPTAKWLRANLLPAPTAGLGVSASSSNQHYGILQIDAVFGGSGGEPVVARLAASVIAYFKMETKVYKDGFAAMVWKPPFRGSMLKDDPWMFIPVSIPYVAFAANPA
jgi:hypothetical protein